MKQSSLTTGIVQGTILTSGTPMEVQSDAAVAEAYLGSLVEAESG